MSGANPVETKPEAPKAAEATALSAPAAVPRATPAGWWVLRSKKRLGLVVGGAVLATGGGWYGYKYLTPTPPRAVAQADPAPAAPKAEEPVKPAVPTTEPAPRVTPVKADPDRATKPPELPTLDLDPPPIPKPGTDPKRLAPAPAPTLELDPPPVPAPPSGDRKPVSPAPTLDLDVPAPPARPDPGPARKPADPAPTLDLDTLPPVKPPMPDRKPDTDPPALPAPGAVKAPDPAPKKPETPTLVLPAVKAPDTKDPKKPSGGDDFAAPAPLTDPKPALGPAPLPADMTNRKDGPAVKDGAPVLRTGGQDPAPLPMPPKADVPTIDVPTPGTPKPPAAPDVPKIDLDVPLPPVKAGDPAAPAPKPPAEVTLPPVIAPMKPAVPKIGVDPVPAVKPPAEVTVPSVAAPGLGDLPAPPLTGGSKPDKRDNYEEDWHTERAGDTYVMISNEYYKSAEYARALEAYNKDRRKPGEAIIRVPPPWVLQEQFPNLIGKADKPAAVEDRGAGTVKFEPATPTGAGSRPAPPPAGGTGSNEYRVTAEAGETIREIARKALGNPEAWKKLWDQNPALDPTQPIPAGTILRLPTR